MITVIGDKLFKPTHIFMAFIIKKLSRYYNVKVFAKESIEFQQLNMNLKPIILKDFSKMNILKSELIVLLYNRSFKKDCENIFRQSVEYKIPLILYLGGTDIYECAFNNDLRIFFERYVSHIIVSSESQLNYMQSISFAKNNMSTILPGIPIEYYKKYIHKIPTTKSIQKYEIAFVGRLVHRKNILFLLDVLKELTKANVNILFNIIGDGELSNLMINKIKTLNLEQNCIVHGALTHEKMLMVVSKCIILCHSSLDDDRSKSSGIPYILLESMNMGLVVIANYTNSLNELIKNGVNGILIKEFTVKAYSTIILDLIKNKKLLDEYRKNARATIKNQYNINNTISELIKVIEANKLSQ